MIISLLILAFGLVAMLFACFSFQLFGWEHDAAFTRTGGSPSYDPEALMTFWAKQYTSNPIYSSLYDAAREGDHDELIRRIESRTSGIHDRDHIEMHA